MSPWLEKYLPSKESGSTYKHRKNNVPGILSRDILSESIADNFSRISNHCRPCCPYSLITIGLMRPQSAPLVRATCRNPRLPPRAPCGARSFAGVSQTNPLLCKTHRPLLFTQRSEQILKQDRCITQAYIQRMKDGKKEWAEHAEEIKAGKRKNFAAHLEERGLIHDVVGYVSHCFTGPRLSWIDT